MSSRERTTLVALLLLAAGLRLCFFSGLQVGDDIVYSKIAAQRAQGVFQVTNVHEARFGFLLPITLAYAVLGPGEIPLVLYNLLCSVGLVGAAWLLARRYGGEAAAAVAGVIAAIHPNLVFFATECHTDTPVAFWQALAVLAYLKATSADRPARWLAASGALIGWAWLHKEHAVFVLPFLAAHGLLAGKRWTWFLPMAAPALAIVGVETALYAAFTGDPLHRIGLVRSMHVGHYMQGRYGGSPELLDRLFLELPRRLFFPRRPPHFEWALNLLGLAAGVWGAVRKLPGSRFMLGWALTMQLAYSFWPSSLSPYLPAFYLFDWTLPPLLTPLACAAGLGLRERRRPAVAGVVLALALCALVNSRFLQAEGRKFSEGGREAQAWFCSNGVDGVVADDKTIEVLDFLDGHRGTLEFRRLEDPELRLRGDVVVLDKFWTEPGRWWSRPANPIALPPPPAWKLLFESDRVAIYRTP